MKIELHDKGNDRNYSLHFTDLLNGDRAEIRKTTYEIHNNFVDCFLQGDQSNWMMIEFWTSDSDKILEAVEYVEKKFGVSVE